MPQLQQEQEISLDDAVGLALRHLNAGNYRVAELTLRDILQSVPDHYASMFYLGMALFHKGDTGEALAVARPIRASAA